MVAQNTAWRVRWCQPPAVASRRPAPIAATTARAACRSEVVLSRAALELVRVPAAAVTGHRLRRHFRQHLWQGRGPGMGEAAPPETITTPGAELSAGSQRLHYQASSQRLHYAAGSQRLHYETTEE